MSASRRRVSTRAFLAAFALSALTPIVALLAFGIYYYAVTERARMQDIALQTARQTANLLDSDIRNLISSLTALATSRSLERGDLGEFHVQAKQLVEGKDEIIVLRTMEGAQLVNTSAPFGAELPRAVPLQPREIDILNAGNPYVSNVYRSPISGEPRIAVVQKPLPQQKPEYLLAITVPTGRFLSTLKGNTPADWVIGVGDRAGTYVTHSSRHDEVTGRPGLASYIAQATSAGGTFYAKSAAGVDLLAGYQRSQLSDWLVAANIPAQVLQAPLRRSVSLAAATVTLVAGLSAVLAWLFSRRISLSAAALAERALALGEGRALTPLTSGITEFGIIDKAMANAAAAVAERAALTERLGHAVAQKDLLLKEVNHRVKNSLQLVASLLSLQRAQIDDPQTRLHFEDAARRINAVAQVHQRLYRDERPDQVAFDTFVRELCEDLAKTGIQRSVRIVCEAQPCLLSNDKLIPLAIILNELIANAFKYSFGNGSGVIRVTSVVDAGDLVLTVRDDGQKLPESFDPASGAGLGMKIVTALVRQLRARIDFQNLDAGKAITIRLPIGRPDGTD
jgi:two-component sensor histidine kinase